MTWRVDRDAESKTCGTLIYEPSRGLSKRQAEAMEGGSSDLVATAIKVTDASSHDAHVYGLLLHHGTPLQCLCLNCWLKQVGTISEETH